MSSLERYADSALARQEVRRQEDLASGEARVPDYFDSFDCVESDEEAEVRRAADVAYRKRLAERIRGVMSQMEKIFPPQGGVA